MGADGSDWSGQIEANWGLLGKELMPRFNKINKSGMTIIDYLRELDAQGISTVAAIATIGANDLFDRYPTTKKNIKALRPVFENFVANTKNLTA